MLGFPLGNLLTVIGTALTLVGFYAYFVIDNATLNLAGFFYGIPLLLGGLALKSAELKPVPLARAAAEVIQLRKAQATKTQNQVRQDVTRFRYGQEAHLDVALEKLGLSPSDDERPELVALREENREGAYTLVLDFASPHVDFETWKEKQERIGRFFGPGLRAEVTQPTSDRVEVALIVTAEVPADV
ncbi:DUF2854 domain-containing protein [Synechococcus elongatus]|uniref:DUF2854 domain-containing protein n=2 Tax=Synechococcus elongatus TaxID=32046 RepID=Q31N42_SYNE7|nr:DUF2854 domain-containing protein [Synechococcus elongatus]ABB57527.1 conserved hypothetical protein [Synechococcus elongatus PCC 7942 = FACHB-805]AJD57875.1 membrane protein [Synechococcus elongatus UTEX 2973]MBD2588330.1 DUF2854 domain-containing protein [Synechococcus elongatus FACHB-242]MBD2689507.1 DUF2854 domain-containing protein [Synechococcus elongatus FACHB-1061]MBD2708074.1 DUF2854 domain-containing protein [Synechococcus elongatus PCC 7942 = FACHB-805]